MERGRQSVSQAGRQLLSFTVLNSRCEGEELTTLKKADLIRVITLPSFYRNLMVRCDPREHFLTQSDFLAFVA
ncbi:hypothetical protein RUM43_003942 [Polyplax serrata]|uniref:Uncharacterized protein n=1 Tax=Polyplax serrata TaxID=468196 RepID=A0AAN8PZ45_POLSC